MDDDRNGELAAAAAAADLRVVLGQLSRRLRAEAQVGGLTWSQVAVVSQLFKRGPSTVSELARAEEVRPQSMGATVAALEAQSIVVRTPDESDGRQSVVSLTERGVAALEAIRANKQQWLVAAMTEKLTSAERGVLVEAAALFRRLLEP